MSNKNSQSGFTLIELLIVVLIIGILASIAIPVFNGQRTKAKNSVAQSSLRNAQSAAATYRTEKDNYEGVNAAQLGAIESSLTFNDTAPTTPAAGSNKDPKVVFVTAPATTDDSANLVLLVESKGDTIYRATQSNAGGKWSVESKKGSAAWAATN